MGVNWNKWGIIIVYWRREDCLKEVDAPVVKVCVAVDSI